MQYMMSSINSRCSNEVQELRWENGQVGVHPNSSSNPQRWSLESIVHQATSQSQQQKSCSMQSRSKRSAAAFPESGCPSASDTATMMTWNSFESSRSLKTARINIADDDDDSVYHHCSENQEGERTTKGRSQSSARRSRAAAIHNLSERRRRDRINEKMKALQKLVPNASKTDKASMLDEVIEYLKQLQAQVGMMSCNPRSINMMNMMMMMQQQQLQMSNFLPFPPPLMMIKPNVDATDAYNTFLAQCMNMELLNKMSALYRQQSSSQQQPSNKPNIAPTFTNSLN